MPLSRPRPVIGGKFLVSDRKLYIRGVTYGAFRPDADGNEYHDLDTIERDFAQMAANDINTVRIPHTTPPRSLLDAAHRHGLWVMVGLSAEQYLGFVIDKRRDCDPERELRERMAHLESAGKEIRRSWRTRSATKSRRTSRAGSGIAGSSATWSASITWSRTRTPRGWSHT